MTTWLEFRSEPVTNVPEVERVTRFVQDEPNYDLTCSDSTCRWKESTTDVYYAEELKVRHEQWHEEGMPQ